MANEDRPEDWRPWGRAWAAPGPAAPRAPAAATDAPGDTNVMWARVAAHLIDSLLIVVLGGLSLYGLGFISAEAADTTVVLVAIIGLNWVLLQGLTGWSVGKRLLRLSVVRKDGSRPGLWAALVRTLPLVVEQVGVFGLIAATRSPTRQRFGDRWAHTYVVRAGSVHRR